MKHIKLFEQFINESVVNEDYDKIKEAFQAHSKEIKDALKKGSGHRYWDVKVLPKWDNLIGGYNLQATAVTVAGSNTVLDSFDIKDAIREVKALSFVSKAMVSRAYNKKMITVIAVGLKIK